MHWTQAIYILALLVALSCWRPSKIVWLSMLANLSATMFIAQYLHIAMVGIIDLSCAAVLIGRDARRNIVAMLFALMPPLYIATSYYGFSHATTYAIVDIIAYVQCMVIGRFDVGIKRLYSNFVRRPYSLGRPLASGHHTSISLHVAEEKDKGIAK